MKTLIMLSISILTFNFFDTKENKIISSYDCVRIKINEGRCTGSSYCSVCSNCSRCAHCSNGGSCGVCSGASSNGFYSSPKTIKKKKVSRSPQYTPDVETKNYLEYEFIFISKDLINLREEPNIQSKIIEKLHYGETVIFLEKEGEWSKVKSDKTKKIGYVVTKLLNY